MPLQPGEQIGPFQVVEQIGAGGFAVVYKARDPLLDRLVAVKHIADPEADRAAIRREAQMHKRLTQDKPDLLVQLIDVVEDERGLMLLSEFVEGESLEQRLTRRTGPMDPKRAVRIIAQVAGALYVLHKRGMIHRDIKPANVLLTEHDRVKLTDFGLTVAVADQRAMDAGTVRYMAPELLRGESADARADLYALGMIAYEMLAGRAKFDEAFAMVLRDRRNAAMRWVKWHTNPRTAAPPLAKLNPRVPPRLAELVGRLMDKDPRRRVASAQELLRALERVHSAAEADESTEDEPIEPSAATAPGGVTAPIPRAGRLRHVLIGGLLVLLLAGLGYGGHLWWRHQAQQRAALAAYADALAHADQTLARGEYANALAQYEQLAQQHSDDRAVQTGVLVARGHLAMTQEQYEEAIEAFEQVVTLGGPRAVEAGALIDQARQRAAFAAAVQRIEADLAAGRFDAAQQTIRQWQPLAVSETEAQQLDTLSQTLADRRLRAAAESVMERARQLADRGRIDDAIDLLAEAQQQYSAHRPLEELHEQFVDRRAFDAALAEAQAAQEAGNPAQAVEAYRRAAALRPAPQLQETIEKLESRVLTETGLAHMRSGAFAEAERVLILALGKDQQNEAAREALARMESARGAAGFVEAGDAAMAQRDYESALRHYENALKLDANDRTAQKLLEARVNRLLREADAAMEAGDVDRASALVSEAARLDPSHGLLEPARRKLETRREYHRHLAEADAARDRSDFGAAKLAYRRAQRVLDTEQVRRRLEDVEYAHSLAQAQAYADREQYVSALAMLRIALQIRDTEQVRQMIAEMEARQANE